MNTGDILSGSFDYYSSNGKKPVKVTSNFFISKDKTGFTKITMTNVEEDFYNSIVSKIEKYNNGSLGKNVFEKNHNSILFFENVSRSEDKTFSLGFIKGASILGNPKKLKSEDFINKIGGKIVFKEPNILKFEDFIKKIGGKNLQFEGKNELKEEVKKEKPIIQKNYVNPENEEIEAEKQKGNQKTTTTILTRYNNFLYPTNYGNGYNPFGNPIEKTEKSSLEDQDNAKKQKRKNFLSNAEKFKEFFDKLRKESYKKNLDAKPKSPSKY